MDGDTADKYTTKFSGFIRATFDFSILQRECIYTNIMLYSRGQYKIYMYMYIQS